MARNIVYRYNGDPASEKTKFDRDDEIPIPKKDEIVRNRGADWKVVKVDTESSVTESKAIPIYRIYLVSA